MTGLDARLVIARDDGFTLNLELIVPAGRTVALLGPNGAGKSTAVACVAGLMAVDAGHVSLGGRMLDQPSSGVFVAPEARNIGVVFQDYLLFDHLDVTDNVAFGLVSRGLRRREARRTARELLDAFDLGDFAERRPQALSGGQAQRVALARALAPKPDLLLLDEPLAALDVSVRSHLRRHLAEHLAAFSGPRVLITHDPTDAFLLADEIQVVENGRLVQAGEPEEIRLRPVTPYVAALSGTNFLRGVNDGGVLNVDGSTQPLFAAETRTLGPVLITISPRAISLHLEQPHGSPRNTWLTKVEAVEPLGDTTRILLGDPLPLMVDITPASATALGLHPGTPIWPAIKATEISITAS